MGFNNGYGPLFYILHCSFLSTCKVFLLQAYSHSINIYGNNPCFHKACFLLLASNKIISCSYTDIDYHYAETLHSEFKLTTVWNLYGTLTVMRTYAFVLPETSQTNYLEKNQNKLKLYYSSTPI